MMDLYPRPERKIKRRGTGTSDCRVHCHYNEVEVQNAF
jgi:hypothetical protein